MDPSVRAVCGMVRELLGPVLWLIAMLASSPAIAQPGSGSSATVGGGTLIRSFGELDRPKILLLSSFERFTSSTKEQEDAVRLELERAFRNSSIRLDYLLSEATTTLLPNNELRSVLAEALRSKWSHAPHRPDLLVTIDTIAFDIATNEAADVFEGVPIVFSGLMWSREQAQAAGGGRATGVLERIDVPANLILIRRLHPQTQRVLIICGGSPYAERHRAMVMADLAVHPPELPIMWSQGATVPDVRQEGVALGPNTVGLYLNFLDPGAPLGQASGVSEPWPFPVYAVFESNLGRGITGGIAVSPSQQGRLAGQMAARVLKGEAPAEIPIVTDRSTLPVFRYSELARWDIPENRLPPGSVIRGRPESWQVRYRHWLVWGTLAAVAQLGIIAALLVQLRSRREAEVKLRRSEERLALAVQSSTEGIWDWDITADATYWSPTLVRTLGLDDDTRSTIGRQREWENRLHPDDKARVTEHLRRHIELDEPYEAEYRLRTADDTYRWFRSRGKAMRDAKGHAVRMTGTLVDVTEQVESREAMRTSEQRFRAVFDHHPYPMWIYDAQTLAFVSVNKAAVSRYGWSREEFSRMNLRDIRPPEEVARLEAFVKNRAGDTHFGVWRHRDKAGEIMDVQVSSCSLPSLDGRRLRLAMFIDITSQLRATRLREEQKRVLEMIATGAPLQEILDQIVLSTQRLDSEVLASILRLQPDGRTVRTVSAPGLPEPYTRAIDGLQIGPQAGSCGTAMFRRERVIVTDIATDPLWENYRDFALSHGLRSCWSEPIHAADGSIMGSMAMYYRSPRAPQGWELELIAAAADLAGIAIERDRAQERIRQSEEKYREIVETAEEGVWLVDSLWRTTFANRRMGEILGTTPDAMLGRPIFEFMDEASRAIAEQEIQTRGSTQSRPFRFVRADKSPVWALVSTNVIRDERGEPVGSMAMVTDITELRLAQERERAAGERLKLAMEAGGMGAFNWDVRTGKIEWSQEHARIWGMTLEEFDGRYETFASRVHPDDMPELNAAVERAREARDLFTHTYRVLRPGLGACWVEGRGRFLFDADGPAIGMTGVVADITNRVEAERAIERERRLFLTGPAIAWRWRNAPGWPVESVSSNVANLGYSPDDFTSGRIRYADILHPDDLDRVGREVTAHVQSSDNEFEQEYRLRTAGGSYRWMLDHTVTERGPDGNISHFAGYILDVTARREAEQAARESEHRLALLVKSTPLAVILWNIDFTVAEWNSGAERIFGYSADEIVGKSFETIVPEASRKYVQTIINALRQATGGSRGTNMNLRKDGRIIHCEWYNTPIIDERGSVIGIASIAEDVSERKQAQSRQELMLAELDHRVKNNLAAVMSMAEQTGRSAKDYREFLDSFAGRLRAMARMHSVLARSHWHGADLRLLVQQTLDTFAGRVAGAFTIEGESVVLHPKAAQALAMAFNELATNAAKYGALSAPGGLVSVTWVIEGAPPAQRLRLQWREHGGPPVIEPAKRGFGSALIEGAIAHELGGEAKLEFDPTGLVCLVNLPLELPPETGSPQPNGTLARPEFGH